MKRSSQTEENYGRFEADDRSWDAAFWQRQGSEAIRRGARAGQSSKTEPGAAPNGGPATPSGNSGVGEGPPPVN